MRASFPLRCWLPTIRWRWAQCAPLPSRAARWCGYSGSGYDDTEDSSCYIPPLTTIKQDFRLLGQTSVDRLLQLSQGQAVKGNQLLPVSLVKRKTTLAPNTQTASPRALADSLMQLARQVSRLESGQ